MEICSTSVSATNISDEVFNTNEVSQNEIEVDEDIYEDANDTDAENILETETSASENVRNKIISYVNGLGGSFNKSYAGKASGCFALCNYVWKNVFGYDYYARKHTRKEDASGGNHIYSFLVNNGAKTGDILWLGGEHNVIILSYDSNGMTITDGSSSGKVLHNGTYLKYTSSGIANYLRSSKKLVLYKSNNAIFNSLATPDPVRDTTPPTIHFIYVTDVSKEGYTVVCQATDESGIDRVQFPTYTDANGRDDMVSDWSTSTRIRGTYIGNDTYSFRVNVSEHNYETGMYVTEIFVYDKFGNQKGLAENEYVRQNVDITPPLSLGNKVDLGASFNAYIKTEYGTYLTADSNGDVRARLGNGQLSQKWTFTRTTDGYYLIRNRVDGYGLDADGGFDISATNIMVHNPHLGANQKWGVYDAGNGSYYLSPESSKITVMDSQLLDQDDSNIYLYQFQGGQNQKFLIQKYDRYAVTLNSTAGGTVSGAGIYNNGTIVTLKATPKSGYEFVGWYSGSTKVSASKNYSFTINNNVIYTAEFKIIENASGTPTKTVDSTNTTDTQIRLFVSRMYTVVLGRDAEKEGLDDWSNQLINHTNDGAGLARGFICSDEFIAKNMRNDDYINTLYKTFFNREPDASGKANWMNALNNGISRNEVLAGFVNSLEFANLCDKYGIARGTLENNGSSIYNAGVRDFVLRMYTKCLNRDGETVGVEDWTNRINTKVMRPEAVAKSFFSSQEFINRNLNNADYVETLYQTFMDRASDEGGKQYWMNKLNSGMSRQQVLEGFSRSEEFSKIMKHYGL